MRINTLGLIGIAVAIASLLSTVAVSAAVEHPAASHASQAIAVTYARSTGQRWIAAGYVRHGKWRSGHCAKDWTAR